MTVAEIGQRMGAAEAREWQALWILDSAPPEEMPAARPPAAATGFRVDSGPVGPDTDLSGNEELLRRLTAQFGTGKKRA